jgi:putative ABC transport system permease protein
MMAFGDGVLYEALPYGLVALGIVLAFRYVKVLDLTLAASFVVGPAIAAALLVRSVPFAIAILAALVATVLLTALTLFEIWALELDVLLASLLTSFVGFSVALLFTQGTLSLDNASTPYEALRSVDYSWMVGTVPLHPAEIASFVLVVGLAKLLADVFFDSEAGLAFRAMEDEHSRTSLLRSIGLSDFRMVAIGLVAANVLSAFAGLITMLKESQVTANRGFDVFLAVITAYLFGVVLFERRPAARTAANPLVRWLSALAVFRPTSAALLGILFYFTLLAAVARLDVPASLPRLAMVAAVLLVIAATRSNQIADRIVLARANRTQVVADNAAFTAHGVDVSYPSFPRPISVIRNANVELSPNSAVYVRGPNGSGKSTLLRFLAGRIPGRGLVCVPSMRSNTAAKRAHLVGFISQDADLGSASTLTVSENLSLFMAKGARSALRRRRLPDATTLPDAIRTLAATSDAIPAGYLSGGQRQLLNVASMLLRSDAPRVILFDEPLTHLDETNAAGCVDLIAALLSHGSTVVLVQHDVVPGAVYPNSPARTRLAQLITRDIRLEDLQP